MKTTCFIWILCIISIVLDLPVYADQFSQAPKSQTTKSDVIPVAVAKEPRFEFAPVVEGTIVTHDFIIENKGNAPLSIEKVKTSCGCTTASHSETIEPGAEGAITIKGNTRGYGGRQFFKTITVYTNDPKQKEMKLYINGSVEIFASVEPRRVLLDGDAGEVIQSIVTIAPLEKYPFVITGSSAQNLEDNISFNMEKSGSKYILKIKNRLNKAGRYSGAIHLKSDSPVNPEIIIPVFGVIKDKKS